MAETGAHVELDRNSNSNPLERIFIVAGKKPSNFHILSINQSTIGTELQIAAAKHKMTEMITPRGSVRYFPLLLFAFLYFCSPAFFDPSNGQDPFYAQQQQIAAQQQQMMAMQQQQQYQHPASSLPPGADAPSADEQEMHRKQWEEYYAQLAVCDNVSVINNC